MSFPPAHLEQRRERVAQLRLRGLSAREIAKALAQGDNRIVNPHTGLPYDPKTILGDLAVLKAEWAKSAYVATDEHISRQYAELQEIKRAAWGAKDPELALKALDKEMKLLGTAKDKDGLTLNINITIISQLVQAIEARGESASQWFEEMLRDLQLADRNGS